jgi:S-formylglutathione hydrolase FrmB
VTDAWLVSSIKNAMRGLLRKGETEEMIFVFPDGTNKMVGSLYMSSPTNGDFETYITNELVDKVDLTYRTIPNRDSRAITGCSMGGMGSLHLALKYPDIYGIAVPMNGLQMYKPFVDMLWKDGLTKFRSDYSDWSEISSAGDVWMFSLASIAAANPEKPPFYFDMPYRIENGKTVIDEDVYKKVEEISVEKDITSYLAQPIRLNNLYIYTSNENMEEPLPTIFSDFDKYLSEKGIQHDFTMFPGGHCTYDLSPVIKYLSDHLVFE